MITELNISLEWKVLEALTGKKKSVVKSTKILIHSV